jgi:hypothetical protein
MTGVWAVEATVRFTFYVTAQGPTQASLRATEAMLANPLVIPAEEVVAHALEMIEYIGPASEEEA